MALANDTTVKEQTVYLVCTRGYVRKVFAHREPAEAFASEFEDTNVVAWDMVL